MFPCRPFLNTESLANDLFCYHPMYKLLSCVAKIKPNSIVLQTLTTCFPLIEVYSWMNGSSFHSLVGQSCSPPTVNTFPTNLYNSLGMTQCDPRLLVFCRKLLQPGCGGNFISDRNWDGFCGQYPCMHVGGVIHAT